VDLSGVDFEAMTDVQDGSRVGRVSPWRVSVPGHGYRIFRLDDRREGSA
jgi:hypothetical protein